MWLVKLLSGRLFPSLSVPPEELLILVRTTGLLQPFLGSCANQLFFILDTKSEVPAQDCDCVRDITVHMASPEHIGFHAFPAHPLSNSHQQFHSDPHPLAYLHDEHPPGQFRHEPVDHESHAEPLDLSLPRPPRGDSAESVSSSPPGGADSKEQTVRRSQRPAACNRGISSSSSSGISGRVLRHSPYPPPHYPSSLPARSGYSSPAASDLQAPPHYYQPSPQIPLSSSPGLFHRRSPPSFYMEGLAPYEARVGTDLPYAERSLHAHGHVGLLTTSHPSVPVLPASSQDRDLPPHSSAHISSRSRDPSPRPLASFFRPFDDVHNGTTHTPVAAATTARVGAEGAQRTSEADLSHSSSLLMLSTTTPSPTACTASPQEEACRKMEGGEYVEGDRRFQTSPYHAQARNSCLNSNASFDARASDPSAFHRLPRRQQTPPPRSPSSSEQAQQRLLQYMGTPSRKSSSPVYENGTTMNTNDDECLNNKGIDIPEASSSASQLPPVLNGTVYESKNEPSFAKVCSPPSFQKAESSKPQKPLSSRFVTVVPQFSLSHEIIAKSERDARKDGLFHFLNMNGIEVGGERNSSETPPMSSEKSDEESVIKPPDPNLKMAPLDYIISKVLVERLDVPFKACNTEIKKIYLGERKGKLRLADLIELQVEESLKA